MNRLKLLAAVALLGIPLAACEEATPPPPVGSIVGTVSIEGTGIDGVSVNLSNGNSTTTAGGGSYRFDNVEGGAYTVTISGFPSDATFDATSAAATISSPGQSVTINFAGAYIRTASVMGSVTVENMGLPGVTVTLTGVSGATATTDDGGQYAFTGLRMGSYSVEISGFDNDEVGFSNTAASVSVGVGESKIVSFDGTYLRTAGIMGRVSVEGEGLEGVTVSLAGGPDNADMTTMTDAAGQYSFAKLRAGDYAVGISGYDTDDYEFEVTSQSVTVALGETANVPFEGVLLRTSGISGRVSVEGMGLDSITVTLSMADADDMTTMTDVGGLYAFAGLAAGDYTVSITVDSDAYVFDSMSMDVTVGDDETAIVNFEGMHDMSATITVQLFIDEGTKNDMHDDGEMTFPTPAMLAMVAELGLPLALPVTLAGPGVHDVQQGTVMPTGAVMFAGLKAGEYQVIVTDIAAETLAALPPTLAAVLRDYAYGGPPTGYAIDLGVGEQAMQGAPIDITHTTVNVAVTLKGGEMRGMPVPGAKVTLYSDAMGETKVGEGTTMADEETGHAYTSIRFARAGTTGNTVHMGVSSDDYWVDPTSGMQAVMWNPMSTVHPAPDAMPPAVLNDANILNLAANFSFGGATISTDHPESGKPLGGWAVSVTSGGDAVEGAPSELDEHGGAAVTDMVMPTDLPKTYMIAVDTVQTGKDDDGYRLDGGENYTADPLMYVHTGLMLADTAAADAGTIEVKYTTQTLKIYVHHEMDQVMGYTGNVQGGDERMSGMVDVEIRYVANGTRRQFTQDDSISSSNKGGVYTFSNVPAAMNVVAIADEAAQDEDDDDYQPVMVLDPDEVSAYSGVEANGIMGGAFGDMGGFHHTVSLCPLMSSETDQRFREDNCGTFAFVNTYHVTGQVWKNVVTKHAQNDFALGSNRAVAVTKAGVPGFTVNMDPVDGENLAMESADPPFEAKKASNLKFDFGQMPAGVYTVSISGDSTKWNVRRGPVDDPTDDLKDRINPLDSILNIDVAPKTGYVYGVVTDAEGLRASGVTVSVNGVEAETDDQGRYIAEGFLSTSYRAPNATRASKNRTVVRAFDPGKGSMEVVSGGNIAFAANTPRRVDFSVSAAADIATVSGSVTHSSGGDGVGGVEIMVDGKAPLNATYVKVPAAGGKTREVLKLLTAADGSYTARIAATGGTVKISAMKDNMFFTPEEHTVSAVKGAEVSGINFSAFDNGTISGRVVDGADKPLSGVIVSAMEEDATTAAHADTTGATGSYVLRVPYGRYNVTAARDGYTFTMLEDVPVPNDGTAQDDIEGTAAMDNANLGYLHLSDVSLERSPPRTSAQRRTMPAFDKDVTAYTDTVANSVDITTVTAEAAVHGATADVDPGDDSSAGGHQVDLEEGDNVITVTVTALDGTTEKEYTITVYRMAETTTVEGTVTDSEGDGISGVKIAVYRTASDTVGTGTTNADGEYSIDAESGGTAMVTPSKKGYTFDPASRSVTLAANATITGIDFEGGTNATITGRVTDGTSGLRDATVSVRPRDGGGTARTATTRASGRFTVSNVSIGWNTVSVTKEGYTFPSRDVHVSGGTVDIGDLEALGTIQATNVEAARDTAADGSFDGNVTVTWAAGAADTMGVAYQVQSCVPTLPGVTPAVTCEEASTGWTALGSPEDAGASDFTVTESNPGTSDNGYLVRVQSTHATLDNLNSAAVSVAGINAAPSAATATRDIDPSPDNLVVGWDGDRAATTTARVIGSFDDGETWVVLSTVTFTATEYSATDGDGDHQWTFAFESSTLITPTAVVDGTTGVAVDGATAVELTAAQMDGAFMVRVQARQPGVDFDDDNENGAEDSGEETWKSSGSASVTAK